MQFLLISLVAVLLLLPFSNGNRIIERFNKYRGRVTLPGMRKLYLDENLVALAKKATDECKSMTEDGDYGIIYSTESGTSESTIADQLAKQAYTNSRKHMTLEASHINLLAPKAYKIGCSYNENCSPKGLYLCYLNGKLTHEEFILGESCSGCSQTFTVCEENICKPEDDKMPTRVIEDEPVVVQTNEQENSVSDLSKEAVNLEESVKQLESNGFIVSFSLMNLFVILFHLVGN